VCLAASEGHQLPYLSTAARLLHAKPCVLLPVSANIISSFGTRKILVLPTNQSTKQPNNQTTNQSTKQPTNQLNKQRNKTIKQPTKQLTNQPNN